MKITRITILALTLAAGATITTQFSWSQTRPVATTQQQTEAAEHYKKAYELYQHGNLWEAQKENNIALKLDPQFSEALILRDILDRQIPAQSGSAGATTRPTLPPVAASELLNEQQITRIRVYELAKSELQSNSAEIRGFIPRATLEQFWDRVVVKDPRQKEITREERDRFLRPDRFRSQLELIKEYKAAAFYDQVKMFSDPAALVEFRNKVQPYLLQNCATAKCHGNSDPAVNHGYRIYGANPRPNDRETYTNFFILSTKKIGNEQMLNRDDPEHSLLIQYGLPKKDSLAPHPGAAIQARLKGQSDPLFIDIVAWTKTLAFPIGDYGITITKPVAATAPATAPASTQP